MRTARTILIFVMTVCFGVDVCYAYHSCRELKRNNPYVANGEYTLWNGNGETYMAYCEFHGHYGYMFIPKGAQVSLNVSKIDPSTTEVLVRHRRITGKQYDTLMKQLSRHSSIPLSIQYNQNFGYKLPQNHANLAPYLYLGFLPINVVNRRSVQGYSANNQDYTFINCDANPNSYMTFFFNTGNGDPTNKHRSCCYTDLMRNWLNVATAATNYLPDDYFFQFEMHMGGCGGYAINGYSTLNDIIGAALGMRFDL